MPIATNYILQREYGIPTSAFIMGAFYIWLMAQAYGWKTLKTVAVRPSVPLKPAKNFKDAGPAHANLNLMCARGTVRSIFDPSAGCAQASLEPVISSDQPIPVARPEILPPLQLASQDIKLTFQIIQARLLIGIGA